MFNKLETIVAIFFAARAGTDNYGKIGDWWVRSPLGVYKVVRLISQDTHGWTDDEIELCVRKFIDFIEECHY